MKVGDLDVGMLIHAPFGARLSMEEVAKWHLEGYGGIQSQFLVLRPGVVCETPTLPPYVYLGFEIDSYCWDGVWKHHRVLADGLVAHVSGYDVRYLEPYPQEDTDEPE